MKSFFILIFLLTNYFSYSQKTEIRYFNTDKEEVTKKQFYRQKNYRVNHELFFKTDSLIIGMLVKRKNQGKLEKTELNQLRQHLSLLSGEQVDSSNTIVINYLSSTLKLPYLGEKSRWVIFVPDYLNNLNKIPNVQQFWVNNPDNQNLEYFHNDRINWIEDSFRIIENLFFPYEFELGSFVVINSDGYYISYFAEYGIEEVIKITNECINLK